MLFFFPTHPPIYQAFFRFKIPEHGVNELFLFAGGVVEPDISMDRTRVDYGALMLGAALKETFHIVNREGMPHSFVFDKNSLGMAQVNKPVCRPSMMPTRLSPWRKQTLIMDAAENVFLRFVFIIILTVR